MGENENNISFDGILEAAVNGMAEAPAAEAQAQEEAVQAAAVEAQEVSPAQETAPAQEAPLQQEPAQEAPAAQPQLNLAELINLMAAMRAENEQLRAAQAQAQQTVQEQSEVVEESELTKLLEPPVLDFSVMEFTDPDLKRAAFEDYSKKLAEYSRAQAKADLEAQIAPMLENYHREETLARENNAISALSGMQEMPGFAEDLPQIKALLENHKTLMGIEPQERYMLGYFINRGINAGKAPAKTPEQIAGEAMANPEVMRIIEAKRAADIEAKNAQVPTLAASQGLATSAVNVNEAPRDFDEARKLAMKMAGINI